MDMDRLMVMDRKAGREGVQGQNSCSKTGPLLVCHPGRETGLGPSSS